MSDDPTPPVIDADYIRQALTLAERGRLTARPNPMVGAVVVRDGEILGRGYHVRPGTAHAEVAAIDDAGGEVAGSTVYLTLEPCAFEGRTPACADLLVNRNVGRVVCCLEDPDARVSGAGFERLRDAGITVEVGLLADEAEKLNTAYLTHRRTGRPNVTLKLAQSLDGSIATCTGDSKWITGVAARARGHGLRAEAQAIVVGVGSVLADDPRLTVRHVEGENPLRVVLDTQLRTPPDAKCLPGATIVAANGADADARKQLEASGARIMTVATDETGRPRVEALLDTLGSEDVIHVLVEGGSRVATAFLRARCVDRIAMFISPRMLGAGIPSVDDLGIRRIEESVQLSNVRTEWLGSDLLYEGDVV